jgi:hypothetical protein
MLSLQRIIVAMAVAEDTEELEEMEVKVAMLLLEYALGMGYQRVTSTVEMVGMAATVVLVVPEG